LSAGTSWRGGRRRASNDGGFIGFAIVAIGLFLVVAWPYLLGTFLAVQMGAGNPSAARTVLGWIFEIVYIGGVIAWFALTRDSRAQAASARTQAAQELAASGAVYTTRHGKSSVYRHGHCTVNHRSHDTAARCSNR
jgi:lysylphosphatidylglycerol synthetase-like protein (DUF2156 family)